MLACPGNQEIDEPESNQRDLEGPAHPGELHELEEPVRRDEQHQQRGDEGDGNGR